MTIFMVDWTRTQLRILERKKEKKKDLHFYDFFCSFCSVFAFFARTNFYCSVVVKHSKWSYLSLFFRYFSSQHTTKNIKQLINIYVLVYLKLFLLLEIWHKLLTCQKLRWYFKELLTKKKLEERKRHFQTV